MQIMEQFQGIKSDWYNKSEISVRHIFEDKHNWDVFYYNEHDNIREVELIEVQKMMTCKDAERGFFVYHCLHCDELRTVYFGCNSRLCSNCGKNYTDKWSNTLSKKMFNVAHRHIVLSVPDVLWSIMREHRELHKVFMDAAIQAINDTLSYCLRCDVTAGAIIVFHPFSRDLEFKCHIHALVTEGGFDKYGKFVPKKFIPVEAMRKTWQYQVLTRLKEALPKTQEMSLFIDSLFKKYPNGFYAHLPKKSRITSKKQISSYVGRYVRHPAIANSRLCGYDGKDVTFWYVDNEKIKHYKTMPVFEFIKAIIQHIPDKNFKMIRYYGAYCRKLKRKYSFYFVQESITCAENYNSNNKRTRTCPVCGSQMEFVIYWKKGPPNNAIFGSKIDDWRHLLSS
jgi:hypothetical protein